MKFLLLLLFPFFTNAQSDTVKLYNGKLTLVVPSTLKPITDEMWKVKYPNATRPEVALGDESTEVSFMVRNTEQAIEEDQLVAYKDFQLNSIKKNRPNLEVKEDGVKTVNGRKVAYVKFFTQAIDLKILNYYTFAIVDKKVVMFTFNCTTRLQKKWEPVGEGIVQSLKIR